MDLFHEWRLNYVLFRLQKGSDSISLKYINVQQLGLVDEDEEVVEATNRDHLLKRGTPSTVAMTDKLLFYI